VLELDRISLMGLLPKNILDQPSTSIIDKNCGLINNGCGKKRVVSTASVQNRLNYPVQI
jgi:hypothetical protein